MQGARSVQDGRTPSKQMSTPQPRNGLCGKKAARAAENCLTSLQTAQVKRSATTLARPSDVGEASEAAAATLPTPASAAAGKPSKRRSIASRACEACSGLASSRMKRLLRSPGWRLASFLARCAAEQADMCVTILSRRYTPALSRYVRLTRRAVLMKGRHKNLCRDAARLQT